MRVVQLQPAGTLAGIADLQCELADRGVLRLPAVVLEVSVVRIVLARRMLRIVNKVLPSGGLVVSIGHNDLQGEAMTVTVTGVGLFAALGVLAVAALVGYAAFAFCMLLAWGTDWGPRLAFVVPFTVALTTAYFGFKLI
jgi:hypothetical protein